MTTQEFLDLVLSIFNIKRSVADNTVETNLVEQFKPIAYRECCMFADWSFLIKTRTYEEDDCVEDEGFDGHEFGFTLPSDFMKAKLINNKYNEAFSIKGNNIYVDYPTLRLDYFSSDYSNAPEEFHQLVAYRCAIDISQMLDPQGNSLSVASSLHQLILTTLTNTDSYSKRNKNKEFDFEDSVFTIPKEKKF